MDAHVNRQGAGRREGLAAYRAFVGFVASVHSHVLDHLVVGEHSSTDGTLWGLKSACMFWGWRSCHPVASMAGMEMICLYWQRDGTTFSSSDAQLCKCD